MKGTLYIQRARGKDIAKPKGIRCSIDLLGGRASAFNGRGRCIRELKKASVEVYERCMLIDGLEDNSTQKAVKYYAQSWVFYPGEMTP